MAQQWLSPKGRSATVVVASSTSRRRFNADLICDGVDDQDTINLAYSYLPAAGGKVLLLEGQFNQKKPIYPVANSWIGGSGPGTILKTAAASYSLLTADKALDDLQVTVADASSFEVGQDCTIFDDDHCTSGAPGNGECVIITSIDGNVIHFTKTYGNAVAVTTAKNARIFSSFSNIHIANVSDVRVSDMQIDGNSANNYQGNGDPFQNGISMGDRDGGYSGYTCRNKIYDCIIHDNPGGGIVQWADPNHARHNTILRNRIYSSGYEQPLHFHGLQESEVSKNILGSGAAGIDSLTLYLWSCIDVDFIGNLMYPNPTTPSCGVWCYGTGYNIRITGGLIENAYTPFMFGTASSLLRGVHVKSARSDSVIASNATDLLIENCRFEDCTAVYGTINPSVAGVTIRDCRFEGQNGISISGNVASRIIRNTFEAQTSHAIQPTASVEIIGNKFIGMTDGAIVLSSDCAGAIIRNNQFIMQTAQPSIELGASNCVVGDNDIMCAIDGYSPLYLNSGATANLFQNNHIVRTIGNSVYSEVSGGNFVIGNRFIVPAFPTMTIVAGTKVLRNVGYIGAGEIVTHCGSIATLTQDAFNSVDNPFGQNVALLSLDIYVATAATATAPNIDCGIGSSATTDYATLFDDLPGETIGFYRSTIATPGTQTVPILWASGSGNRYLNMSIKGAAATGMVATYVATVMGL